MEWIGAFRIIKARLSILEEFGETDEHKTERDRLITYCGNFELAWAELDTEEKKVVFEVLMNGRTCEDVARELSYSRPSISRRKKAAALKLERLMGSQVELAKTYIV